MDSLIQDLVLGALLLWSVLFSVRRILPTWTRAAQSSLSARAEQQGWPRLAQWLQPSAVGGGCGSGCNTCSTGCQTSKPLVSHPVDDEAPQVVVWRQ